MDDTGDVSFLNAGQNAFVRIQRKTGKRFDELFSDLCRLPPLKEGALRASVMQSYGLTSEEAHYLVDMAREADAAAVVRDSEALKQEFTYRSYDHDMWQVFLEDTDRPFFAPLSIAGLPLIAAEDFVEQCYYEKGALEPLAKRYCGYNQWPSEELDRLLPSLETAGLFDAIERVCTSIARSSRSKFFAERAGRNGYASDAWVEKFRDYALTAHDRAIEWLERVGRAEAAADLTRQREAVREGRLPELPQISDLRRMDETVFWELIARSRSEAEALDEQLMLLERLLQTFKAAEIKRFGSLYAGYMRKLHHWDVWALAYAARGGCSDNSFVEFRTWLILQGDPALVELALNDPARAAMRVPRDPELPDGSLSTMIEEAFLQRKGTPMAMACIDLDEPRGKEWPEEEWESWYPRLARHYSPQNVL